MASDAIKNRKADHYIKDRASGLMNPNMLCQPTQSASQAAAEEAGTVGNRSRP